MLMTGITEKRCSHCEEIKAVEKFYRNGRGFSAWCKECAKKQSKQRVQDGRDRESKLKYEAKTGHIRGGTPGGGKGGKRNTPYQTMASAMLSNAKKRAAMAGKDCDLDLEYVLKQVTAFCEQNYHELTPKAPFKPSINRLDNSKGYTRDNVEIIWLIENYCRNTYTNDDVIKFCKLKLEQK